MKNTNCNDLTNTNDNNYREYFIVLVLFILLAIIVSSLYTRRG